MEKIIMEFRNPFKPSAGHMPPYLAGREVEQQQFRKLLEQEIVMANMIITGLRGTGKTVLLETLKPIALEQKWLWLGTDMSESASVSEETIAIRLLTDLAVITSDLTIGREKMMGFNLGGDGEELKLNYQTLISIFSNQPGLISDKLKATLELAWAIMKPQFRVNGIIFAYDEAQNMSDQSGKEQFPLSVLLDVFQSIQRKNVPFMLVLVGLPTLFPKLVEARTYSERMFRIIELNKLSDEESREAITKPIEDDHCPIKFDENSIQLVVRESGGYPYFIQFICREIYDIFRFQKAEGVVHASVPMSAIIAKLDTDFFSGRWMRATDRQKELLKIISMLDSCEDEFAAQEIFEKMKTISTKPMSASHISQMLSSLINSGLIHKSRHGRYSFAVPLLGRYIGRQKIELR